MQARLNYAAQLVREDDQFYRQLVEWKGEPSGCRGRASGEQFSEEYWLEFSWPDGSTFESSFEQPESSVIQYKRAAGFARPDDVIATALAGAAQFGLHVDWATPESTKERGLEVVEYKDPNSGVNGIVRFTYDRKHRLVGAWVSMTL